MRIGINAKIFTMGNYTGIARSVHEILNVWAVKYPEHEFFLLTGKPIQLQFDLPSNWHIVERPWIINKGKLWTIFELPKLIKELDLDVYWGTNFTLPNKVNNKTKYIVTVYDLAVFKFKNIADFGNEIRLKLFAKKSCHIADRIVAISHATANDIEKMFNISADKISISYCGGLPSNFRKKEYVIDDISSSLIFDSPFFAFISTIEPRKNIVTIIKAFEKFTDDTHTDFKLVLAGKIGWKCDQILDTIKKSKYRDRIILSGFISDAEKSYLLQNATCFLYPSLYEGFGIPILEAFEYETMVITSNNSSMPEVGGNAALYLNDVYNIEELAELMNKVYMMNNSEKTAYKTLMKQQRKLFSWEKNAHEMMRIIEELGD